MPFPSSLFAQVMLALTEPSALAANIVSPQESTVGAIDMIEAFTARGAGDIIPIVVDTQPFTWSTCTIAASSAVSGSWVSDGDDGTWSYGHYVVHASDPLDEVWEITCGASPVAMYVGDVHGAVLLDDASTSYQGCTGTYTGRMCDLMDEYDLPAGAGLPDDSYFNQPAPPTIGVAPDNWSRQAAWSYLLDESLPPMAMNASVTIPDYSSGTSVSGGESPADVFSGSRRSYGRRLSRLALAWRLAHLANSSDYSGTLAGDQAAINEAAYLEALGYWGDALVAEYTDWGTEFTTGNPDLERAEILIGLCLAYDWAAEGLNPTYAGTAPNYDRRREWAEVIAREASSLFAEFVVGTDPDYTLSGSFTPARAFNWQRSAMLNGHKQEVYAAIGIAALVLGPELTNSSTDEEWLLWTRHAFDDILMMRDHDDGWDHNGSSYHEDNLTPMMQYLEAERTLTGAGWAGWPELSAEYLRSTTRPDRRRFVWGDASVKDGNGPSHLAALAARVLPTGLSEQAAQVAWQGHAPNAQGSTVRDYLDILWLNADVSPVADDGWRNQCARLGGAVKVASGWEDEDAALSYMGGRHIGGHDDPSSGAFQLYYLGSLVTDDGKNLTAKRTALHSTFLIDGWGQHGDGNLVGEPVPNTSIGPDINQAWLRSYTDGSGVAGPSGNTREIDLVSFGSDLTQLYRVDTGGSYPDTYTDLMSPSQAANLVEARRYIVWLGRDALVYDRFGWTGNTHSVDWMLTNGDLLDNEATSGYCAVDSTTTGYWDYDDTLGTGVEEIKWTGDDGGLDYEGMTSALVTFDMNEYNLYEPVVRSCSTISLPYVNGAGDMATLASDGDGELDVYVLDGNAATFEPYYSAAQDGGKVYGTHLRRHATWTGASNVGHAGYLLHALRPYDGTGSAPGAFDVASSSSSGTYVDGIVSDPHAGPTDLHMWALFAQPGQAGTGVTDMGVVGVAGVVLTKDDPETDRYAAQLIDGTYLTHEGDALIDTSGSASVSVTWGPDSTWGTVHPRNQPSTDVWVSLQGLASPTTTVSVELRYGGSTSGYSRTVDSSGGVTFTAPHNGATFSIFDPFGIHAMPSSSCLSPP